MKTKVLEIMNMTSQDDLQNKYTAKHSFGDAEVKLVANFTRNFGVLVLKNRNSVHSALSYIT